MKVLAGDIGGTNARFAIIERDKIIFERHYPSRDNDKATLSRLPCGWNLHLK